MAKDMGLALRIGEVARDTGLTVEAIRFYEKKRLLKSPPRTAGGFRLFTSQDVGQVRFIQRAQHLGFSLAEVKELLALRREDVTACKQVRERLDQKVNVVRCRIRDLQQLERELKAAMRKCDAALEERAGRNGQPCPVLHQADRTGHTKW